MNSPGEKFIARNGGRGYHVGMMHVRRGLLKSEGADLPANNSHTCGPAGRPVVTLLTVLVCLLALAAGSVEAKGAAAAAKDRIFQDWLRQDAGGNAGTCFQDAKTAEREAAIVERVANELDAAGAAIRGEAAVLTKARVPGRDPRWRALYTKACEQRRARRLRTLTARYPKIVFTKHFNMGGSHYAYTEGQSDAQAERHFRAGGALCVLEMDGIYGTVGTLIRDARGVIRNPDVSYDGTRILFAWKKDDRKDDYHLYEMEVATRRVRQLTSGLGFADYECAYLPNGDIVFNSTRCVQTVDCWWTEVSNLYTCDGDGRYMRRLSFDQVHTNYPTVMSDGRVIYTRWDYNDRGQLYPQPLFQMNADGTGQTEFYGNNSWFPTTIAQARGIPNSTKVMAIATGHHSGQSGKLILIDPSKGRQEAAGITMLAPVRPAKAVRVDAYGQRGEQFQYPYPLSETELLVTYATGNPGRNRPNGYGLYWMHVDGRRELLTFDPKLSSNQPVPLAPRPRPHRRPSAVDYRKTTGVYYVQDVYAGPGLEGIPRGTAKRLRVVALEYRAAGIGSNGNGGPAGGALVSTPVAVNNGSWDVKRVLGSVPVEKDGSAFFTVPARTPVYFQVLDRKGHTIQSMRSWSTLQPGETFSCVGCHESKRSAPPVRKSSIAMKAGPRPLEPFYGPPQGFSFAKVIQPILDKHCVRCHNVRPGRPKPKARPKVAFSLLGDRNVDGRASRYWSDSYLALTQRGRPNRFVRWLNAQSVPSMLPPYHAGACKSGLLTMIEKGHHDVRLSREETEKIACWIDLLVPFCGDYTESAAWRDRGRKYAHFQGKRDRMAAQEAKNIQALVEARAGRTPEGLPPVPEFKPLDPRYRVSSGKPRR